MPDNEVPESRPIRIVGFNRLCLAHPKVNGKYITNGDLFDLYATELGKPHDLICFYQRRGLIDLEVLQWRRGINGYTLPRCLSLTRYKN